MTYRAHYSRGDILELENRCSLSNRDYKNIIRYLFDEIDPYRDYDVVSATVRRDGKAVFDIVCSLWTSDGGRRTASVFVVMGMYGTLVRNILVKEGESYGA